jgi:hypothetical protein
MKEGRGLWTFPQKMARSLGKKIDKDLEGATETRAWMRIPTQK